nr:EthD family reductase [Deltaproteobacteria bacterium]
MIKVAILYPNTPGSRFDMDYYAQRHMPMVKEKMAGACTHFTIDRGLAGGAPGSPAAYAVIGQLFFESLEGFQRAFGPHAKDIAADVPNYTDVHPVLQISEVLVG